MLGNNDTPFAAIGFEQAHRDGSDMAVVAVRGSFEIQKDGQLSPAAEHAMVLIDEYEGHPHSTPLVKQADLIPYKPGTDITVLAISYPPQDGECDKGWLAGVRMEDYRYALRVFGSRTWLRNGQTLKPGRPAAPVPIPIDYRNAWGDLAIGEQPDDPPPYNSIGVRRPPQTVSDPFPVMANLESLHEDYGDPYETREPQGFGPMPPFWRSRQQFAGTYDEEWIKHRHPRLPQDFDYRFYQCAHPRLICEGFLQGSEEFELYNLRPNTPSLTFRLPGIQLKADYRWLDDRRVSLRLNLDGVHIDARGDTVRVDITWRAWLPTCPQFHRIDLSAAALGDSTLAELPFSGLHGVEGYDEMGEAIQ